MGNMSRLQREIEQILRKLEPAPERETRLPYIVALPGWETHNQEHQRLARRYGIAPKVYEFDPSVEGTEGTL